MFLLPMKCQNFQCLFNAYDRCPLVVLHSDHDLVVHGQLGESSYQCEDDRLIMLMIMMMMVMKMQILVENLVSSLTHDKLPLPATFSSLQAKSSKNVTSIFTSF